MFEVHVLLITGEGTARLASPLPLLAEHSWGTDAPFSSSPEPPTELPCEAVFERLAAEDPDRLIQWILGDRLGPADLTVAAEIAGRIRDPARVIPTLRRLLDHESPLVREGAVLGLAQHLELPAVTEFVRVVAEHDANHAVRTAARDVLS